MHIKTFYDSLVSGFESRLRSIPGDPASAAYAARAQLLAGRALGTLDSFSARYAFADRAEESAFFKEQRPVLAAIAAHYDRCFDIESCRPMGAPKKLCRYYRKELAAVRLVFKRHNALYAYYLSGGTAYDEVYFTGGEGTVPPYSARLAQLLAAEQTAAFLEARIAGLSGQSVPPQPAGNSPRAVWSGPKVALVELMYALHAAGVVNGGTAPLSELAAVLGQAFSINLGQFHRVYLEIRARKVINRTSFLSLLSDALLRRMDDADAK